MASNSISLKFYASLEMLTSVIQENQCAKEARQAATYKRIDRAISYSWDIGNMTNCFQDASETTGMVSMESTQRETMVAPISCSKTVY